jgi:hypothetical protein
VRLSRVAPALTLVLAPQVARADAFTVFGFGPAAVAEANARTARADDGTAAHLNPGGLALGRGSRLELGGIGQVSALSAGGRHRGVDDPVGVTLAIDADVPLEGPLEGVLRVGLGMHALPTRVMHVALRDETTPQLPYYDNRTQRLVMLPAIAARLAPWLGIGAAFDSLAGLAGSADLRPGASRVPEPRTDEAITTRVRPILGVRVDPLDRLHLGLTWRGAFRAPVTTETRAEIAGVPLYVHASENAALFDPAQITLGAAWDLSPRATVEVDVSYAKWSSYPGPGFSVTATLPGLYAPAPEQPALYRDVWSVRAGGSQRLALGRHDLVLRAGGGYEPSMMTDALQGATNLVDASKIVASAGVTVALRGLLSSPLRIGLGAQAHVLPTRSTDKVACSALPCAADTVVGNDPAHPSANIADPGYPRLSGGGAIVAVALSLGVDL